MQHDVLMRNEAVSHAWSWFYQTNVGAMLLLLFPVSDMYLTVLEACYGWVYFVWLLILVCLHDIHAVQ